MRATVRCRFARIKECRRLWKIRLIESMNPEWIDLFDERTGEILDGPADLSRESLNEVPALCMGPVPSAHGALRRRPARDDVGGGRAALATDPGHKRPG